MEPPSEATSFTWMFGSSSDSTTYFLAAVVLFACTLCLVTKLAQRTTCNLPPGPRGLPLIGDVLHSADQEWLASLQRKDEYGDRHISDALSTPLMHALGEMMYISALGQGILVLNSQRVAVDLLEKRSNIYSDRPHYISGGDFLTQNLSFALAPYGDQYAGSTFAL